MGKKKPLGLYVSGTDQDVAEDQIKYMMLSGDENIVNIRRMTTTRGVASDESFDRRNDLSESFNFEVKVGSCIANVPSPQNLNFAY